MENLLFLAGTPTISTTVLPLYEFWPFRDPYSAAFRCFCWLKFGPLCFNTSLLHKSCDKLKHARRPMYSFPLTTTENFVQMLTTL